MTTAVIRDSQTMLALNELEKSRVILYNNVIYHCWQTCLRWGGVRERERGRTHDVKTMAIVITYPPQLSKESSISLWATNTQKIETGATIRNIVRASDLTSGPKTNLPWRKNFCDRKANDETFSNNRSSLQNLKETTQHWVMNHSVNQLHKSVCLLSFTTHLTSCKYRKQSLSAITGLNGI